MTDPQDDPLLPRLRVTQIIALAMVAGPLVFLAIVLLTPVAGGQRPKGDPVLTWICLGAAPIQVLLAFLVADPVARRQRRAMLAGNRPFSERPGMDDLPPGLRDLAIGAHTFQVKLIIRLALLESGVFFALVAYLVEQQSLSLLAAVVLLVLMAASFPTRERLERWLDERPERP